MRGGSVWGVAQLTFTGYSTLPNLWITIHEKYLLSKTVKEKHFSMKKNLIHQPGCTSYEIMLVSTYMLDYWQVLVSEDFIRQTGPGQE